MCGTHLCSALPQTTTTITVSYCLTAGDWHAHICAHSTAAEGETTSHGSLHRDFGPFDTAADVLQWAYREASAQIRQMPGRGDGSAT